MIFITVGTTPFPFPRMNSVFRELVVGRLNNEEIIYQHGATTIETKVKNVQLTPSLSFDKVQEYIKQARTIITHGGPATIYQCFYAGKKPFVLPREKRFGEHVDDHQLYFSLYMKEKGVINLIQYDIKDNVDKFLRKKNYFSFYRKSNNQILKFLSTL